MLIHNNSSSYPLNFSHYQIVLKYIVNSAYISGQFIGLIFSILNIFWLINAIYQIYWQRKQKNYLLQNRGFDNTSTLAAKIFNREESTIRHSIFLMFILVEIIFCLSLNFYGLIFFVKTQLPEPIYIGGNCTLQSGTFLATSYDPRVGYVFLDMTSFITFFTFSMMVWLFGASLLHLSYAARIKIVDWGMACLPGWNIRALYTRQICLNILWPLNVWVHGHFGRKIH